MKEKHMMSNCCGAYMHDHPDSDICPECKEHCQALDRDDICSECGQVPEEGACYYCKMD